MLPSESRGQGKVCGCCRRRGGSWKTEGLVVTWWARNVRDKAQRSRSKVQGPLPQAEESEAWGTQAQ